MADNLKNKNVRVRMAKDEATKCPYCGEQHVPKVVKVERFTTWNCGPVTKTIRRA
jgi:hypothetical protein